MAETACARRTLHACGGGPSLLCMPPLMHACTVAGNNNDCQSGEPMSNANDLALKDSELVDLALVLEMPLTKAKLNTHGNTVKKALTEAAGLASGTDFVKLGTATEFPIKDVNKNLCAQPKDVSTSDWKEPTFCYTSKPPPTSAITDTKGDSNFCKEKCGVGESDDYCKLTTAASKESSKYKSKCGWSIQNECCPRGRRAEAESDGFGAETQEIQGSGPSRRLLNVGAAPQCAVLRSRTRSQLAGAKSCALTLMLTHTLSGFLGVLFPFSSIVCRQIRRIVRLIVRPVRLCPTAVALLYVDMYHACKRASKRVYEQKRVGRGNLSGISSFSPPSEPWCRRSRLGKRCHCFVASATFFPRRSANKHARTHTHIRPRQRRRRRPRRHLRLRRRHVRLTWMTVALPRMENLSCLRLRFRRQRARWMRRGTSSTSSTSTKCSNEIVCRLSLFHTRRWEVRPDCAVVSCWHLFPLP